MQTNSMDVEAISNDVKRDHGHTLATGDGLMNHLAVELGSTSSGGDENDPRTVHTLPRPAKRSTSKSHKRGASKNRFPSSEVLEQKRFKPHTDGFKLFFSAARRLSNASSDGMVSWNEIRNIYRKETGRHLNAEELNLICGSHGKTKNELLEHHLMHIIEPVDSKCLILRLAKYRPGIELSTPSPITTRSPTVNESDGSVELSPTLSQDENSERDRDHKELREVLDRLHTVGAQIQSTGVHPSYASSIGGDSATDVPIPTEVVTSTISEADVFDVVQPSPVVIREELGRDVSQKEVDMVNEANDNHTNTEEVVEQFERSLLGRRNSIDITDAEDNLDILALKDEENFDNNTSSEVLHYREMVTVSSSQSAQFTAAGENTETTSITCCEEGEKEAIIVNNSIMNAGFLTEDSRYYNQSCGSANTSQATSGMIGYSTPSALEVVGDETSQVVRDHDDDLNNEVDLELSLTEVPHPTPRRESDSGLRLCSSRNESGLNEEMPTLDVSPLSLHDSCDAEGFVVEDSTCSKKEVFCSEMEKLVNHNGVEEIDGRSHLVIPEIKLLSEEEILNESSHVVNDGELREHAPEFLRRDDGKKRGNENAVAGSPEASQLGDIPLPQFENKSAKLADVVDMDAQTHNGSEEKNVSFAFEDAQRPMQSHAASGDICKRVKNESESDVPYDDESQTSQCAEEEFQVAPSTTTRTVTVQVELNKSSSCEAIGSFTERATISAGRTVDTVVELLRKAELAEEAENKNHTSSEEKLSPIVEPAVIKTELEKEIEAPSMPELVPSPELAEAPMVLDEVAANVQQSQPSGDLNNTTESKKAKRVRIQVPRRRLINCCAVL